MLIAVWIMWALEGLGKVFSARELRLWGSTGWELDGGISPFFYVVRYC
jgi:hypothetical protein